MIPEILVENNTPFALLTTVVQDISNCIVCVVGCVCVLTLGFEASQVAMLNVKMVKFIDLFHLYPWPKTIIERPYIVKIDTLFHFLTDLIQNISLFPLFSIVLTAILNSNLEFYAQDSPKTQ